MTDINPSAPEPVSWTVDGLTYAGLAFGPINGTPVLALHGWLDNASSFARLARALPEIRLVAVDLSGHGLSDHRSPDASYQIWDDLPQLKGILDALGWETCTLLGHSRGAMIATLLAASQPERFTALITLDSMLAKPVNDDTFVGQLRSFVTDRDRIAQKPTRVFASSQDYVTRRSKNGEPAFVASQLCERSLKPVANGLQWRGDPRLSGASAVKMNVAQCETVLRALTMPVLNLWATPRPGFEANLEWVLSSTKTLVPHAKISQIPGPHHWHMDEDTGLQIASEIRDFLANTA